MNIYNEMIAKFGQEYQLRILAEELLELNLEIVQGLRKGFDEERTRRLEKELADVLTSLNYVLPLVDMKRVDEEIEITKEKLTKMVEGEQ